MLKKKNKLLFWLFLYLFFGSTQANISLQLVPIGQNASSLEIGVVVSGLGVNEAPSIGTYDFSVQFDDQHVSWTNADFGDPILGNQLDIGNLELNITASNLSGLNNVNLIEVSLDSVADLNAFQSESFILTLLNFDFISENNSQLSLIANGIGDANGDPLSISSSSLAISNVNIPLPATGWLMLSGMAIMIRKKGGNFIFHNKTASYMVSKLTTQWVKP